MGIFADPVHFFSVFFDTGLVGAPENRPPILNLAGSRRIRRF